MLYFLGSFVPKEGKPPVWEIITDYYLHHTPANNYSRKSKILTQWWDKNVLKCLPYSLLEVTKTCSEIIQIQDPQAEMIDVYYDYYRYCEILIIS